MCCMPVCTSLVLWQKCLQRMTKANVASVTHSLQRVPQSRSQTKYREHPKATSSNGTTASLSTHVCWTASSCFTALRQLRSIRHLISAIIIQSQLLLLWSSVDCTMAMAHWLASLLTYLVGATAKRSSETGIPSPSIWPHRGCTRQHPLAASAWKDYFQDRHADLSGSP